MEHGVVDVLVAGQLHSPREARILARLARLLEGLGTHSFRFHVLNHGEWSKLLARLSNRLSPAFRFYSYPSLEEAVRRNSRAHLGLVVSTRTAFTLSRIYYYTTLGLPQLVYDEKGYLAREMSELGVSFIDIKEAVDAGDPRELKLAVEEVLGNYAAASRLQYMRARELAVPGIHRGLARLLG
jgi:hypothetical protein